MGALFYILLVVLLLLLLNPLVWIIILTIILFARRKKKKKIENANTAEINPTSSNNTKGAIVASPPNPMAKWNWLLYIGSFLIVLAMLYFVDTINGAYVAPTTIFLTIVIYIVGIVIHRRIDYLRPVAKAFVYSALCMIPIWIISLTSLGVPNAIAPLYVTPVLVIASFLGTHLLDDNVMGHIAFLTVMPLVWSFYNSYIELGGNINFLWPVFLAPIITALPPMILHLTKPRWLPNAFVDASRNLGIALMPIIFGFSLVLLFIPNVAQNAPFLRTICAAAFLLYAIMFFVKTKKRSYNIALRFAVQALIITGLFDVLKYSIFTLGLSGVSTEAAACCCMIVWLLSFTIQDAYSLLCKKSTPEDEKLERGVGIASIICIFMTPMISGTLDQTTHAIIMLAICLIVAVLGVVHAIHYKHSGWYAATTAGMLFAPYIIGANLVTPNWTGSIYMVCYTLISLLFLLGTYLLQIFRQKDAHLIGAISVVASCLALVTAAADADIVFSGYLISAAMFGILAFITKIYAFYEVAIYTGAVFLMSLTNTLIENSARTIDFETLKAIIYAHIIGLAFIGAHFVARHFYQTTSHIRYALGYTFFTIISSIACLSISSGNAMLIWAIVLLFEQAFALAYSVYKKENWMTWLSSIVLAMIALRLTSGLYFLWIGIIGIGLIVLVVWQLSKANKK